MSDTQPTATSYAYDRAYCQAFDLASMGLRDAQVIALDFEERFEESDAESVVAEWSAYVADIGGFANFPSYVRALYASRHGLVTCATCGDLHWYMGEVDGMTTMLSLAGFACGQEDEEEQADVNPYARRQALAPVTDGSGWNPWPRTPSMTRAQFEYLARILFEASREEAIEGPMTVERMVGKFAYHLADTNARFDSERFITAATA